MFLKSITLRDWKAYGGESRFEFPAPTRKKNVILIGAPNGFGKTSILEALLFGLYGRDALPLVGRANRQAEKESEKGYPSFLQRAFHARALPEGRTSMTVELNFEDASGEIPRLTISRTWHFKTDGAFKDEEILIYTGEERRPLRAPRLEDDAEDFFRGYVARHTLSSHLAQFFLFDGEQVQRLAQSNMAEQVRIGIEGMLGASVLRMLATDLEAYAKDRKGALRDVARDGTLEKVRNELETAEAGRDASEQELNGLIAELVPLQKRRDEISARFQGLQGGNVDNAKELQRKKDHVEAELVRLKERLSQLLTNEFALAIAGRPLREQLRRRLAEERELAAWEGGIQNSARQLQRFMEEFEKAPPPFAPSLNAQQEALLREKVEVAWQKMWHPPPDACAGSYRHSYLAEADRVWVDERIKEISALGQSGIQDLLYELSMNEADRRRLDAQLQTFNTVGSALETLVTDLQQLSEEIGNKTNRKAQLERELVGLRAQVQSKKAEYERLSSSYASAQPAFSRISWAEKIASMMPEFVEDSCGAWVTRIAELMTEAYREIAHKGTIHRVDIDRDCQVRLLTKGGDDYRTRDASAGEDQVFSFALISAIARAAEVQFPIVIDTPLARLDREHRLNILKHFTERAGEQIILLSQNTEVVGEYLDVVRGRVAKTFLIEHKQIGNGFGQNRVSAERYFESV